MERDCRIELAVHVRNEEFLNTSHFQIRLHELMLRSLPSVEYPTKDPIRVSPSP